MSDTNKRIVVALDYAELPPMYQLIDQLDPNMCRLKVGKELFTRYGANMVSELQSRDFDVFLDLKFHDIPNTVAKAVAAAADLGVWMVNVHAQGGSRMMEAARESLEAFGKDSPLLIAVTILTSMSEADLKELGLPAPELMVPKLAQLAKNAGLDGVVSSAREAQMIKDLCGADFTTVTPGIRPKGASQDDQTRILTPSQAVAQGADYLVIGRPITRAENPLQALQAIHQEIQAV
ncbi:MAG: orotidine-5'-phosphate decarboxylase [Pseudomonadales bacterium]|nr:orotidine-5'-phosphate decarboxylase [Pseudomonadales bacterium]